MRESPALAIFFLLSGCWIIAGTEDFEPAESGATGGAGGSGAGTPCMGLACLGLGDPCTAGDQCTSGFCAHGVCCESACDAACRRCDDAGSCGVVTEGDDPNDRCEGAGVCDPAGTCAEGVVTYLALHGGDGRDGAPAVATDADGNILLVGETQGGFTFGAPVPPLGADVDTFVGTLNSAGLPISGFNWGSAASDLALDAVFGPDGSKYIVGGISHVATWGGQQVGADNNSVDGFAIQQLPNGAQGWRLQLVTDELDQLHAVSLLPSGNLLTAGQIGIGFYFAEIDAATGVEVWTETFDSALGDKLYALDHNDSGRVAITGPFANSATFGATVLTSQNNDDIFVAAFDDFGQTPAWAKSFGSLSTGGVGIEVAVDDAGRVALVGGARGSSIDFGRGPVALADDGNHDIFVALFDPDGALIFGEAFAGPGDDIANDVDFDLDGNVVVTGFFRQSVDVLGGQQANGGADAFVLGLTDAGVPLWWLSLGDGADQSASRMTRVGNEFLVTGSAAGTLPVPGGTTVNAKDVDILLFKVRP